MRNGILLIALLLAGGLAHADDTVVHLPKQSVSTGLTVSVPADAKILGITATASNGAPLTLYLKDGSDFDTAGNLLSQAQYYSNNTSGSASLAIGTYAQPALHAGDWHVALANRSTTQATDVTLTTAISTHADVTTDFEIHFGAPTSALEDAFGGADKLECDVAPWTDATALGDSTLGEFRQQLLKDTLTQLASQIHTPVPVHIQACWKSFDDSGAHAGSYTLAAATGTYLFYNDPGAILQDTWYSMAAAERLAGARACDRYTDLDCSIPEIVVWYNSADAAKGNYDGAEDEPLIRSVTMHEITHGLGFLSLMDLSETDDNGDDNPNFLKLFQGRNDAFTVNVGYESAPADHPLEYGVTPLEDLGTDDRLTALTSGQYLVWMDTTLADSSMNVLNGNTPPRNLVELHAASEIQPGSTMSHLSGVHYGQLMTAVIQGNHPQTLGLAGPMLERMGWNTSPISLENPSNRPIPGNWYDPAHSGHGIDLEPITRDPAGDRYAVIFYTYDNAGKSEYYYSGGRVRNGVYEDADTAGQAAAVGRPVYDPSTHQATYPGGAVGSLQIDFSSAAASDPACAGRSDTHLALMHWSIGADSGTWCIVPLIGPEQHPAADSDLNGLWNAGSTDSGWGMSVTETASASGERISPFLLYYYDNNNQPRWAQAELNDYMPGQTVDLYDIHGYCRTCSKVATTHRVIGSMTLDLNRPENVESPSGDNTVTIGINDLGVPLFSRSTTPLRMYSLENGQ